jgi:hypothetical protein
MGRINDAYGPAQSLQFWAALPVVLCIVFAVVYLNDKARGGYQVERLEGERH